MDERFFYQQAQLSAVITDRPRRLVRHQLITLAQCDGAQAMLLACDEAQSALFAYSALTHAVFRYGPYGQERKQPGYLSCTRFKGERWDAQLSGYCLGQGYRVYSPRLMRFLSRDTLSPFMEGGVNCYGFCAGDPVNYSDSTGHVVRAFRPTYGPLRLSPTVGRASAIPSLKQRVASNRPDAMLPAFDLDNNRLTVETLDALIAGKLFPGIRGSRRPRPNLKSVGASRHSGESVPNSANSIAGQTQVEAYERDAFWKTFTDYQLASYGKLPSERQAPADVVMDIYTKLSQKEALRVRKGS